MMFEGGKICIFCNETIGENNCIVSTCIETSNEERFLILLTKLALVMEYSNYTEELLKLCKEISNLNVFMAPLNLIPLNEFSNEHHKIDVIAQEYLQKCSGIDTKIIVPIDSKGDFNCLYSYIRLLVPLVNLSTAELRVRTIVELVLHFKYYNEKYLYSLGELSGSLKDITIMNRFSDGYEVAGLSTVMNWEIKMFCPELGHTGAIHKMDVFLPRCWSVLNCPVIRLLWSHVLPIRNAVTINANGISLWSPNHFVPILPISDLSKISGISNYVHVGCRMI